MSVRALVAALALSACAPYQLPHQPPDKFDPTRLYLDPRTGTYDLDKAFTAEEVETFEEAVQDWHDRTNGLVSLEPSQFGIAVFRNDRDPDSNGRTTHFPFLFIELDPGRVGPSGKRTCIHELGHAFGLDHSDSPDDVMYVPSTNDPTISDGDVRALCRVWGCP